MDRSLSRSAHAPHLQELIPDSLCDSFLRCPEGEFVDHPFRAWFNKQTDCKLALATFNKQSKRLRWLAADGEYQLIRIVAQCLDEYLKFDVDRVRVERVKDIAKVRALAKRTRREISSKIALTTPWEKCQAEEMLLALENYQGNPLNPNTKHEKLGRQMFIRNLVHRLYATFYEFFPTVVFRLTCVIDSEITQRAVDRETALIRAKLEKMYASEKQRHQRLRLLLGSGRHTTRARCPSIIFVRKKDD